MKNVCRNVIIIKNRNNKLITLQLFITQTDAVYVYNYITISITVAKMMYLNSYVNKNSNIVTVKMLTFNRYTDFRTMA